MPFVALDEARVACANRRCCRVGVSPELVPKDREPRAIAHLEPVGAQSDLPAEPFCMPADLTVVER